MKIEVEVTLSHRIANRDILAPDLRRMNLVGAPPCGAKFLRLLDTSARAIEDL